MFLGKNRKVRQVQSEWFYLGQHLHQLLHYPAFSLPSTARTSFCHASSEIKRKHTVTPQPYLMSISYPVICGCPMSISSPNSKVRHKNSKMMLVQEYFGSSGPVVYADPFRGRQDPETTSGEVTNHVRGSRRGTPSLRQAFTSFHKPGPSKSVGVYENIVLIFSLNERASLLVGVGGRVTGLAVVSRIGGLRGGLCRWRGASIIRPYAISIRRNRCA